MNLTNTNVPGILPFAVVEATEENGLVLVARSEDKRRIMRFAHAIGKLEADAANAIATADDVRIMGFAAATFGGGANQQHAEQLAQAQGSSAVRTIRGIMEAAGFTFAMEAAGFAFAAAAQPEAQPEAQPTGNTIRDYFVQAVARLRQQAPEATNRQRRSYFRWAIEVDGVTFRAYVSVGRSGAAFGIDQIEGSAVNGEFGYLWNGGVRWNGSYHNDYGVRRVRPALEAALLPYLRDLAADPVAFAAATGRAQCWCCFCSRPLTDDRSTTRGYGPVCARTYHLPWGD